MKKLKNPKLVATTLLSVLFLVAMIMLFALGTGDYIKKHPKVSNYANSICQVNTTNYQKYDCSERYLTYSCYGPIWEVHYGPEREIYAKVETEDRYRLPLDALNKAKEYQIGMNYSCWYDRREPSIAQWDKPNAFLGIILLSTGGLSLLLFIIFFFLSYRFSRQRDIKKQSHSFYS